MSWVNHTLVKNVTFIDRPHALIGVAETWNLVLTTFPRAPWVAICAHDISFQPGQLRQFSRRFWRDSGLRPGKRDSTEAAVNFAHTKVEYSAGMLISAGHNNISR